MTEIDKIRLKALEADWHRQRDKVAEAEELEADWRRFRTVSLVVAGLLLVLVTIGEALT